MDEGDRIVLRRQVIDAEGLRLTPYRDTMGKLTIGVGRNLDDVGISREEAMHMLSSDLERAENDVRRDIGSFDELSPARQRVLVEMAFNLGIAGLKKFQRMLAALDAHDYKTAAAQMRTSLWAQQVGARAERLAKAMETGKD